MHQEAMINHMLLDQEEGDMPKLSSSVVPTHHQAGRPLPAKAGGHSVEAQPPPPAAIVKCPRCDSANTKFCYYNNYSLTQPRHFCKNCRRYWTQGGSLRNVPVGGGCRKNKRVKQRSFAAAAAAHNSSNADMAEQLPQHLFSVSGLLNDHSILSHLHPYHGFLMDGGLNAAAGFCSSSSAPSSSSSSSSLPSSSSLLAGGLGSFGPSLSAFPAPAGSDHHHHHHHHQHNINLVNNNILMPPPPQASLPTNDSGHQLLSLAFARLQESLRLGGGGAENVHATPSSSPFLFQTNTSNTNGTAALTASSNISNAMSAKNNNSIPPVYNGSSNSLMLLPGSFHQRNGLPATGSATATLASLHEQLANFNSQNAVANPAASSNNHFISHLINGQNIHNKSGAADHRHRDHGGGGGGAESDDMGCGGGYDGDGDGDGKGEGNTVAGSRASLAGGAGNARAGASTLGDNLHIRRDLLYDGAAAAAANYSNMGTAAKPQYVIMTNGDTSNGIGCNGNDMDNYNYNVSGGGGTNHDQQSSSFWSSHAPWNMTAAAATAAAATNTTTTI